MDARGPAATLLAREDLEASTAIKLGSFRTGTARLVPAAGGRDRTFASVATMTDPEPTCWSLWGVEFGVAGPQLLLDDHLPKVGDSGGFQCGPLPYLWTSNSMYYLERSGSKRRRSCRRPTSSARWSILSCPSASTTGARGPRRRL